MTWHKPQYIIHWEYVCYASLASLPTVQSRVSGVHSYCSECTVDNCLPKFVVTTIRECDCATSELVVFRMLLAQISRSSFMLSSSSSRKVLR